MLPRVRSLPPAVPPQSFRARRVTAPAGCARRPGRPPAAARRRGGRPRADGRRPPPRRARSRAWTSASGRSGPTSSPSAASSVRPTDGSIASAARARPPPSSTTASPTARTSTARDDAAPSQAAPRRRPRRRGSAVVGARARKSRRARRARRPCARIAPPPRRTRASATQRASPSAIVSRGPRDAAVRRRARASPESRRASRCLPVRKSTAFWTSTALPAALASGSFMSVISETVGRPAPVATVAMLSASSRDPSSVGHERARAGLDVHDEPLEPGRELLRQDRGGDERDRFDRRGHVADRVEAPVGGRERRGLADDRAADVAHHLPERSEVGLRVVAGDRIELVERAAGVAEAAAGDHRHVGAAGREHRREHQRDVVADAAGRVLVEDRAGQVGVAPVERRRPSASSPAVSATRSASVMPRKNTAMAKAAACPSVTVAAGQRRR